MTTAPSGWGCNLTPDIPITPRLLAFKRGEPVDVSVPVGTPVPPVLEAGECVEPRIGEVPPVGPFARVPDIPEASEPPVPFAIFEGCWSRLKHAMAWIVIRESGICVPSLSSARSKAIPSSEFG